MDRQKVKERIKTDKEFLVGSLIALYYCQESDERATKTTAYKNNVGFNGTDSKILTDMAEYYLKKEFLTDKQLMLIRSKMAKYAGQIAQLEPKPLKIGTRSDSSSKKPPKQKKKQAEVYDDNWTKIKVEFPYDQELVHHIKGINGRKFIPEGKHWTVPLTITNVDRLLEADFLLSNELNEWYLKISGGVTSDISVPGLDDVLRPFQKEAVSYIESRDGRALIADEPGLGKSLESISWIQYHGEDIFSTIIVCPANLKLNWLKEFKKFTDFWNQVEVLYGITPYKPSNPILIINYDILHHWVNMLLNTIKPTLIIADELHKAKNRKRKRTKALGKLAKYTKYFIGLTGTPIDNRPVEIFQPLQMIKPTLFPNFWSFAQRYCNPTNNGWGWDFRGATNTLELHQILVRECMIRRKKEDVLKELPSKSRTFIPMEIDNREEYNKARDDLIKYLQEIDPEKAKRAKRAETLAQIATLRRLVVRGKMKQAIDWIEDFIENEKLVVFTYHQETAKQLMDHFENQAVKLVGGMTDKQREKAKNSFQNDENIRLFVGQIAAAGEGIDLFAASNVAFVEHPWTPGGLKQGEDRVHRIGQTLPVTCWNLVGSNTIDEEIAQSLEAKMQTMSEVIDGEGISEGSMFDEIINKLYSN